MQLLWSKLDGQKIEFCNANVIEFFLILLWPKTLNEETVVKDWGSFC